MSTTSPTNIEEFHRLGFVNLGSISDQKLEGEEDPLSFLVLASQNLDTFAELEPDEDSTAYQLLSALEDGTIVETVYHPHESGDPNPRVTGYSRPKSAIFVHVTQHPEVSRACAGHRQRTLEIKNSRSTRCLPHDSTDSYHRVKERHDFHLRARIYLELALPLGAFTLSMLTSSFVCIKIIRPLIPAGTIPSTSISILALAIASCLIAWCVFRTRLWIVRRIPFPGPKPFQ